MSNKGLWDHTILQIRCLNLKAAIFISEPAVSQLTMKSAKITFSLVEPFLTEKCQSKPYSIVFKEMKLIKQAVRKHTTEKVFVLETSIITIDKWVT